MITTKLLVLAARTSVAACLLLAIQPQARAAAFIAASDDSPDSLVRLGSRTLDTDAVLRDLAAGRYRVGVEPPEAKRGPWRRIGRAAGRIAKYGPLAGVIGHRKNLGTTKLVITLVTTAAGIAVAYVAAKKLGDTIDRVSDRAGELVQEGTP